jgi:signal transduction histidine kinase
MSSLSPGKEKRSAVAEQVELTRTAVATPFDIEAFHEELRRKNQPLLLWSVVVFNIAYVSWTVFDFFLAPAHWRYFLALRIIGALLNTLVVTVVRRARFQRYTWEAFWALALVWGGFIAPMLPFVGESYPAYVMGFSIVIFGAGLLPFWQPRWTVASHAVLLALAFGAFLVWPSDLSWRAALGSVFFIATASGLAIASAYFKYDMAKRDYLTRSELAEVARLEADARIRLGRASADLQQALDQLKNLDLLKSQFFANVSHELRTPLTLILAPVEKLAETTSDPEPLRYIRVIRNNAHRLLRLIDDLLDLSRLDAGGLRLNLADVDARAVAATVYENSKPAAMAKDIAFELAAQPSSRRIFADAHRLEIVLTNLVGNALKFTPPGGRIDLLVEDLPDGVRIEVADTGPGIPDDALPRVFDRFFQLSTIDHRREGGVGIGLALAKELVELHGGSLQVTSEVGRGTKFTVFIPFGREHIRPEVIERRQTASAQPDVRRRVEDPRRAVLPPPFTPPHQLPVAPAAPSGTAVEPSRRARIVLAEDNQEMCEFIRGLLEPEFELYTAADGDEAWELVAREVPDLLISDVMMPGRSGTELCRDIKASPALASVPVILLTARVGSEATLEGYAHGADDFVAKPFHPRVLLARVRAQLKLRALGLQLAERERLAVVGTLAAGILHEVRNPVNAILNAARILAGGGAQPEMSAKLIGIIGDAAERIQGIATVLESHARPAEAGGMAPCDVGQGLDATLRLLEYRMDGVAVHRDYGTTARAEASGGPVNQVFLNLFDNALRTGARNLWVRTGVDRGRLTVRIGDDGPGVSAEIAQRIFDPFFTTRDGGIGLGLYLSRRIVEGYHGALWLEERQGGGAEFVVELPAAPGTG